MIGPYVACAAVQGVVVGAALCMSGKQRVGALGGVRWYWAPGAPLFTVLEEVAARWGVRLR